MDLAKWVDKQRYLLDEEWRCENELSVNELNSLSNKQLQRRGVSLLSMKVSSVRIGLFGKTVITFSSQKHSGSSSATAASASSSASSSSSKQRSGAAPSKGKADTSKSSDNFKPLPPHKFSTGDIVRIVPYDPFSTAAGAASAESNEKKLNFPSGIVSAVTDHSISIAFSENIEDNGSLSDALGQNDYFRIDMLPNEATRKKTLNALVPMEMNFPGQPHAQRLASVLFDDKPPKFAELDAAGIENISFVNKGLNDSQKQAVKVALAAHDVAVIHGPPGSGKTTVVVELIYQAVKRGERVLVCTPSNVAVDNVVQRLGQLPSFLRQDEVHSRNLRIARVGHPARLMPEVMKFSLDSLVFNSDESSIVRDAQEELRQVVQNLTHGKRTMTVKDEKKRGKKGDDEDDDGSKNAKGNSKSFSSSSSSGLNTKRIGWKDAKVLRKEIREREEKVVRNILSPFGTDVVCCTNIGAASLLKLTTDRSAGASASSSTSNQPMFDMLIIDEASQAIEASCWIAIPLASKLILAGDHKQLPPTIMSEKAAKEGLETTLMDRVVEKWEKEAVHMLDIQYRMNQTIMQWSSDEMYQGRLKAAPEVANRTLFGLQFFQPKVYGADIDDDEVKDFFHPLLLVDTSGCGLDELMDNDDEKGNIISDRTGSKYNPGEADLVCNHVFSLLISGIPPDEIAVITPYSAQVGCIRDLLLERANNNNVKLPSGYYADEETVTKVEIRSVDGFQGREKEAVVLSLVRSNEKGQVGFLSDQRRLNVAITRAKRHVCIVCDVETLQKSGVEFLDRMINYFQQHGQSKSAHELLHTQSNSVPMVVASAKPPKQKKKQQQQQDHQNPMIPNIPSSSMVKNDQNDKSKISAGESLEINQINKIAEPIKVVPSTRNINDSTNKKSVHAGAVTVSKVNEFIASEGGTDKIKPSEGINESEVQQSVSVTATSSSSTTKSTATTTFSALAEESDSDEDEEDNDEEEISVIKSVVDMQLEQVRKERAKQFEESKIKKKKPAINTQLKSLSSSTPKPVPVNAADKRKNNDMLPGETEEQYLERMVAQSKQCHFKGCSKPISLIGSTCKYCKYRYCFSHHVPEEHGCRDDAITNAKQIRNATLSSMKRGEPEKKKMSSTQVAALKTKLAKNIAEKEAERAPATSKDKSKKKN